LNDIASFRGHLEKGSGKRVPTMVAASRWLHDVYDKVMALMPPELASRLAPAEIFHEVLEHRWFLSEEAGCDIGTTAAARSYFENVLPSAPAQLVTLPAGEALPRFGEDTGAWSFADELPTPASPPVKAKSQRRRREH
jgi:hypothetical protein